MGSVAGEPVDPVDERRDAYLATMADLGVDSDLSPEDFLTAMGGYEERDPELAIVVSAIKATVKGGRPGQAARASPGRGLEAGRVVAGPVPADVAAGHPGGSHLPRPDQPPPEDRQARFVHRPVPGRDPVRLHLYAATGESPLDFLPYWEGKPLPGGFKLGINPGLVKLEGTQAVLWGEEVREWFNAPGLNLARYTKGGIVTDVDYGERSR